MRVAVVVAAMLFCMPVFAQGVKLKSVTNSIGMELIEIPAGKFTMGSPAGEKDHQEDEAQVTVTLTKPFSLGKYEVTQGQWKSVMGTEPWNGQDFVKADKDCPATYVKWNDATELCEKLTELERESGKLSADEEYRLPTEAEWEYACRAGTTTAFSFGDDESKLGEYGWFSGNTDGKKYAHEVGLKKPDPWGLHDMHGNVWEWCSDWYGEELSGGVDPNGPNGGAHRVFRSGSWRDSPDGCRSANRNGSGPTNRFDNRGFRVARSQSKTVTAADRRQRGSVTNSIGMELIEIPAGKFTISSLDDEKRLIPVTLTQPFGLGKTEVTQGQWKSVMGSEPWDGQDYVQADKDCPATYVSWGDAKDFCKKLTEIERKTGTLKANERYRLPTEAEWEYACRAGTTTAFSFGNDESKLGEYAWFSNFSSARARADQRKLTVDELQAIRDKMRARKVEKVRLKKPNPWDLYDMHGNVSEWCSNWYGDRMAIGTDPNGPNGGSSRVLRGGSWWSNPGGCRSASRSGDAPSRRSHYLGFRVARSQSVQ